MRLEAIYDSNVPNFRGLGKGVRETLHNLLKGSVKAGLKRILLPAPHGLPTFRSQTRASFDQIARQYGLRGAGRYVKHPWNDMKEKWQYYKQFDKRKLHGLASPVSDNGGLDRAATKYDYVMYISSKDDDGFDYFEFNEYYGNPMAGPGSQKSQPWDLLTDAGEEMKKYLKTGTARQIPKLLRPTIKRRRRL